jgi:hypothetical protein
MDEDDDKRLWLRRREGEKRKQREFESLAGILSEMAGQFDREFGADHPPFRSCEESRLEGCMRRVRGNLLTGRQET